MYRGNAMKTLIVLIVLGCAYAVYAQMDMHMHMGIGTGESGGLTGHFLKIDGSDHYLLIDNASHKLEIDGA